MKYNTGHKNIISRASSVLLAMALITATVFPMTAVSAYAVVDAGQPAAAAPENTVQPDSNTPAEGEAKDADAEKEKEKKPATTVISNCKTSYNKRLSKPLEITADVTPADGREVQLQRYSSADNTWTTICTSTAGQSKEEAGSTAAPGGEANGAAAQGEVKTDAAAAQSAENAEIAETNVSISVPAEERNKTSSLWRIYVPATDDATEAYSENISVITRNIEKLDLSARAACINRIDGNGTGTLIASKNAFVQHAQASTTKLMTAILLLESGQIDSTTKISPYAASTPYGSGRLAAGDVYSNRDLLYAMLVPSSNDAATAVAESIGGSEAGFVNMMNAKAAQMGFKDTHFRNAHGLDADGHYTTALELAQLTAYAYNFPEIRDCWATRYKTIRSLEKGRKWTFWSTNAIFGYISNFLGGKTGTEGNAGCCFSGVYTYGGSTYVTVVLGSGYGFSRWSDTKKLHRYIENYAVTGY